MVKNSFLKKIDPSINKMIHLSIRLIHWLINPSRISMLDKLHLFNQDKSLDRPSNNPFTRKLLLYSSNEAKNWHIFLTLTFYIFMLGENCPDYYLVQLQKFVNIAKILHFDPLSIPKLVTITNLRQEEFNFC